MKNKLVLSGTLIGIIILFLFFKQTWLSPEKQVIKIEKQEINKNIAVPDKEAEGIHFHAVPNNEVCMAINVYSGKKLIPVTVDEKTYYGCCGHCTAQLSENKNMRYSRDPHTMKKVDKSMAHIVLEPKNNGDVVYFESENSLNGGSVMIK